MDLELMAALGKAGAAAALGLAATGSALGTGSAGLAAIGAWKKAYAQNKSAPFILITFIGAPLSQTIYGMILMNLMIGVCDQAVQAGASFINWPAMLAAGIFGGLAMGASSWFQGKAGAAASDALGETGQGFGNYLMTIGIVETVALFILVFIQAAFT
ncbi:ATP synthase subunit K [Desulfovermiculus halophilus]|jgi:V/A-type H+-transporting ATPase subunit K|uniref:ATP synthase subunit K n=1 Tax=Desulfovermiculus halophilus TaxID=339722 RepID=UPI0006857705|nr:ATP synthase subunit K [Desulfovermiculus halophilus]